MAELLVSLPEEELQRRAADLQRAFAARGLKWPEPMEASANVALARDANQAATDLSEAVATNGDVQDHLVTFSFQDQHWSPCDHCTLPRSTVRSWSTIFEEMLQTRGLRGETVALEHASSAVFRQACIVMLVGQVPHDACAALTETHPLLEFAIFYDIKPLQSSYIAALVARNPVMPSTVGHYLNIAVHHSLLELTSTAMAFFMAAGRWQHTSDLFLPVLKEKTIRAMLCRGELTVTANELDTAQCILSDFPIAAREQGGAWRAVTSILNDGTVVCDGATLQLSSKDVVGVRSALLRLTLEGLCSAMEVPGIRVDIVLPDVSSSRDAPMLLQSKDSAGSEPLPSDGGDQVCVPALKHGVSDKRRLNVQTSDPADPMPRDEEREQIRRPRKKGSLGQRAVVTPQQLSKDGCRAQSKVTA